MTYDPPSVSSYDDRSHPGVAYAKSQSCYSDSEPDYDVRKQLPSPYRPTSSAISRLQDPRIKCDRNLGWNIDWAVAFIVDHLGKKSDAAESLRSIRIKAATLKREGFAEDIPYRIFNRLDETLFAGHLKNAVYLSTNSPGSSVSGATYTQNWGPVTSVSRVSMILNRDMLDYARSRDIVALLIHQMIHAYFLIACGPQKEDEVTYGRLSHGYHFGKIMTVIKSLSAAHGKELTSLDYALDFILPSSSSPYYEDDFPRRRPRNTSPSDHEEWYCTHCHAHTPTIRPSSLEEWYTKTISPLLTLRVPALRRATAQIYNDRRHELETQHRARLPPSTHTIEIIYNDTCTLLPSALLDTHVLSARRALSHARILELDGKGVVGDETVRRFLEFAHMGRYRPEPSSSSSFTNHGGKGAVISPTAGHNRSGEAWILADVQFVKFATEMRFEECRAYALQRLNKYFVVNEDLVEILAEIFKGREPCGKLREWVGKFLVASPSSSAFSTLGARHDAMQQTNLAKLENENGPWRARFIDAVERSGGLENEVRKAREEIVKAGWDASSLNALMLGGLDQPRLTGGVSTMGQNLLTLGGLNLPMLNSQGYVAPM
jgi:hypothetical protein